VHPLQGVTSIHGAPEAVNAIDGVVDHTRKLGSIAGDPVFPQAPFRLFRREPIGIPVSFLRRTEPQDFAEVRVHRQFDGGSISQAAALAARVTSEACFFHAAVNPRLFKCFKGCRLGMGESRFGIALGEGPASAAGLHQKEFNGCPSHPITHSCNLFAAPQSAKMREGDEFGGWRKRPDFGPGGWQTRFSSAHDTRVREDGKFG
jgi:hypothetical protein